MESVDDIYVLVCNEYNTRQHLSQIHLICGGDHNIVVINTHKDKTMTARGQYTGAIELKILTIMALKYTAGRGICRLYD